MALTSTAMLARLPPHVARLVDEHGRKALRYCAVSAVNVIVGMSTLAFFYGVLDWDGVPANIMSWLVSTGPAYLMSRQWVWQQSGRHSFQREVLPFWIMALAGLIVSTVMVAIADLYTDRTEIILAVTFMAFGIVWVAKYLILDRIMWRHIRPEADLLETA